jgi:CheY-like chemotaxis protein
MRVLVVEDEPKMATLVARGLREEGHAADVAAHGEDALWMANGEAIQQRRLAGAARAHDRDHLAAMDRERDRTKRVHRTLPVS